MTLLVWDLETAPDLDGFAKANGLTGKSITEVRDEMGTEFPKLIYHSIICIGALLAEPASTGWTVSALVAPHVGETNEKTLIQSFVEKIGERNPQLVTFNGNSFDLPVLRYRAMIHEISAPSLSVRPYFHRFTNDSVDLCDVLSSYNRGGKAKLDEICRIMNLPGKSNGITGSDVDRYYLDGRIEEIADYCKTDVINTYRLWLRHQLFLGNLSKRQFDHSENDISKFIIPFTHSPSLRSGEPSDELVFE